MNKVVSWVKVIGLNVFITLALVGALLLSPPIIFSLFQGEDSSADAKPKDKRGALEIYKDFDWAERHFEEFADLSTTYADFITWRRDDYSGDTMTIVNGVRKTYADEKTAAADRQFWFFGGSTTWGTGVTDDLTYPSIFAQKNGVAARNFGESGYIARQSLSYLQNAFINGEVKAADKLTVVFYDGVNEVVHRCRSEISGLGTGRESQIQNFLKVSSVEQEKRSFAYTFSQLLDLASTVSKKLFGGPKKVEEAQEMYDCHSDPQRALEIATTLVRTWEAARDLAETHGAKFIAVLQPVAFDGRPVIDYLQLTTADDLALAKQYEVVYPLIKKLAKASDISYVDATAAFDGCKDCYIDFCHVGPQAHQLLVADLSRKLLAQ